MRFLRDIALSKYGRSGVYLAGFVGVVWLLDFIGRVQTALTLPALLPHVLGFVNSPSIVGSSVLISGALIAGALFYAEAGRRQRIADSRAVPPFDIREALEYLADWSVWGKDRRKQRPDDDAFSVAREIHQAARAGKLVIWGRVVSAATFDRIPADFWETSGFDLTRLFTPANENVMVQTGMMARGFGLFLGRNVTVYEDLRVDHDEVKQVWRPRISYLLREVGRQYFPWRNRVARLPLLA